MNRTEKEQFVGEIRERLGRTKVLYLTDFSGLDVKSMTVLRQRLRDHGAEYVVGKNRLVRMALQETDYPDLTEALKGPTGVIFGYESPVEPAKMLTEFAKAHGDRPVFKLGVLESKVVTPEQLDRLARLPGREELLGQLAGALQAPMAMLLGVLTAKLQEVSGLLEALKNQRSEAGGSDAGEAVAS